MKIVGITGNSGAGKTTICKILKEKYSVYVIDADNVAKELSKKGTTYLKAIVDYFGKGIIDSKGELKRKELAKIIYEDNKKRKKLNELTFVYVVDEIKKNINGLNSVELVAIDAPLLFESELNQICDIVIGVIAKQHDKIERICSRDNVNSEIAKKRLNIQKNDTYIKEKSDYIIYNNADIQKLEQEIEKIMLNYIKNK